MERILLLGCCGAGKSTLARQLNQILNLELIHLDQHYWRPNWTETPKEEWRTIVQELANRKRWIIDGNYSSTIDIRIDRADTIIYLDYSTAVCMYRVIKRILQYRGQVRPDMPEACQERFDLDFLHYVLTFNFHSRPRVLKKIKAVENHKQVYVFKNDKEARVLLDRINDNLF